MQRERKRPDWQQLVYSYWARPVGELPEWYWTHIKIQNEAWNALIRYREGIFAQIKDIEKKEDRKPYWANFFQNCRDILGKYSLSWEDSGELFDRFIVAHKAAMKRGYRLRWRSLEQAKLRPGADRTLSTHRLTAGGASVEWIHSNTGWRIGLRPVDPAAFADNQHANRRKRITAGCFGMDKNRKIRFVAQMDRPLPPGAFVKKVYWSGKFVGIPPNPANPRGLARHFPASGWQYSIQFVCEIPPVQIHRADRGVAGLDLGWRSMEERSYLRIGMISDSAGRHFEIRFPLERPESHAKRELRRYLKKQEIVYDSYISLMDLSSLIGNGVEVVKGQIKDLLHADWLANLDKMRQGGLKRILAEMRTTNYQEDGRQELEEWEKQNDKLNWILRQQTSRLISNRRHIYREVSAWMNKNYRIVSWEGDLSLKDMAESTKGSPVLGRAAKFRHWACLSELRASIKHSSKKTGNLLHNAKAAGTSNTCYICGGKIVSNPASLRVECENGHGWDQDENSSMILLGEGVDVGLKEKIVSETDLGAYYPIEIPTHLKHIIVPITEGQ